MKKILKLLPDRWDILGVVGVVSLGAGVFLLAGQAWTFVYGGAVLVAVAVIGARNAISTNRT